MGSDGKITRFRKNLRDPIFTGHERKARMMFTPNLDTHEFLTRGWATGQVPTQVADSFSRRLGRLSYLPLPSDHCDAGPRERGDLEASPSVGALLASFWGGLLKGELSGLQNHYRADKKRTVVTALRLSSGYSLDWHNHLAAGCTATLLLYLFSGVDVGEGGDLVLGNLAADMRTVEEVHRFQPGHGDMILIGDASHPLMMHKAEQWSGPGYRYLVSFAFNADDW